MRCFGVVRCIFVLLNMLINALLQSVLITITVIEVPGLEFFSIIFYYRSSRINAQSKLINKYQALIKYLMSELDMADLKGPKFHEIL